MRIAPSTLALAALLATGCGQNAETKSKDSGGSSVGNPVTAPVDYLEAVNKGRKKAENTADITTVSSAVQMFKSQEERFPKDLQELVTEGYLKELPKDRYGRQLVYDPKTGQVRVDPRPPQPAQK